MTDWLTYLHWIRKREIQEIFYKCPLRVFPVGLELGAGDGYQSSLLGAYVKHLLATDWDVSLLLERQTEALEVYQCDAEAVAETFAPASFDLVFSSNMMEHLPNPSAALRGIHSVLKEDGLSIHLMPNPLWKVADFSLFWPDMIARKLRRFADPRDESSRYEHVLMRPKNNPKTCPESAAGQRRFWPRPHGAYRGHVQELWAFRKTRWLQEFERAGFRVVCVIKGPLCSGYGLGWDRPRRILERLGLTSEYAYVAVKRGRKSPYVHYFSSDVQGVTP